MYFFGGIISKPSINRQDAKGIKETLSLPTDHQLQAIVRSTQAAQDSKFKLVTFDVFLDVPLLYQ